MLTNRCGMAGVGAPVVEPEESTVVPSAVAGIGLAAGVSTLKKEIACGLRSSASAKSSRCKFSTTFPVESRTTTRTRTRLTRTRNVAGESWVATSAVFCSCGAGGAGAGLDGPAVCVCAFDWPEFADAESWPLQRRAKANPQAERRLVHFSRLLMWLGRTYLPLCRIGPRATIFDLHRNTPRWVSAWRFTGENI